MKAFFAAILLFLGVVFFAAGDSYIMGRILLPELGLMVPAYWTWFWVWFFGLIMAAVLGVVGAAVKEVS